MPPLESCPSEPPGSPDDFWPDSDQFQQLPYPSRATVATAGLPDLPPVATDGFPVLHEKEAPWPSKEFGVQPMAKDSPLESSPLLSSRLESALHMRMTHRRGSSERQLELLQDLEAAAHPAGEHGQPKRPFSRCRCLWEPDRALDEDLCEPFAKLEVTLIRGHNFVAADSSGLSDPFCTLELNGKPTGLQTTARRQTLAPVWNESFTLDIYQPDSILTIIAIDKDFGTNLAALDFLGLDDDFLGWVDLQLGVLPFNVQITGWFDLGVADSFVDSLAGRRRIFGHDAPSGAGRIQVSMLLKARAGLDELFACALPSPSLGEDLPPLNLIEAKDTYSELLEDVNSAMPEVKHVMSGFSSVPSLTTIMFVLFIWYPDMLLPLVLLLLAMALLTTWLFWPCWHRRKFQHLNGAQAGGAKQPLLEDVTGKATDEPQKDDQVANLLKTIQPFLDPEGAKQARRIQNVLTSVLQLFRGTQELVRKAQHRDGRLLLLALLLLLSSAATAYWQQFTGSMMASVLTVIVCVLGLQASLPVTVVRAVCKYWNRRKVRAVLTVAAKKSSHIELTRISARCMSSLGLPVWKAEIAAAAKRRKSLLSGSVDEKGRLGALGRGLSRDFDHVDLIMTEDTPRFHDEDNSHDLAPADFMEPTWCNSCGGFLWGVANQGFKCKACQLGFCKDCAQDLATATGPLECKAKQDRSTRKS